MSKFFVQNNQVNMDTKTINLIGEDVNHIRKVLRYEVGDKLNVCTDDGINYLCEVSILEKQYITCKILEGIEANTESNVNIHIFQGIPKGDKFELIIEKCTELGVKEFTPINMSRCVVKLDRKEEDKKILRWQKVAEAAAKQSGRSILPKINSIKSIKELENMVKEFNLFIAPYECEEETRLKDIVGVGLVRNTCEEYRTPPAYEGILDIGIIIGPEGGFEREEIEKLKQYGAKVVTLGKRILRTETVGIAIASILQYEFENM